MLAVFHCAGFPYTEEHADNVIELALDLGRAACNGWSLAGSSERDGLQKPGAATVAR